MEKSWLLLGALVAGSATGRELWVQAQGPSGDGSRQRPLTGLDRALARTGEELKIHLLPGRYHGPFVVRGGRIDLSGSGRAVFDAPGSSFVLQVEGRSGLSGLTIEGADTGISIRPRAQVEIRDSRFFGRLRRAIESIDASLNVEGCRFDGSTTALFQNGGHVAITGSALWGGAGPGLFAAEGTMTVNDVAVGGHEYALQTRRANLHVHGLVSIAAKRGGIALVGSTSELSDVFLIDSGSDGGLQVIVGTASLRRLFVSGAEAYGLLGRNATIELVDSTLRRIADAGGEAGDGLHLRNSKAILSSVRIHHVAGSGVFSAEGSRTSLRSLQVTAYRWAGIAADSGSEVKGVDVWLLDASSASVAVPGTAKVVLDFVRLAPEAEALVWADCVAGASARLTTLPTRRVQPSELGCVRVW